MLASSQTRGTVLGDVKIPRTGVERYLCREETVGETGDVSTTNRSKGRSSVFTEEMWKIGVLFPVINSVCVFVLFIKCM